MHVKLSLHCLLYQCDDDENQEDEDHLLRKLIDDIIKCEERKELNLRKLFCRCQSRVVRSYCFRHLCMLLCNYV